MKKQNARAVELPGRGEEVLEKQRTHTFLALNWQALSVSGSTAATCGNHGAWKMLDLSTNSRRRVDLREWPYGVYYCDNERVIFNMRYEPIVRIRSDGAVSACDRGERIAFLRQGWFYRDVSSPTHDRGTRKMIERIIDTIPELRAEIAHRATQSRIGRRVMRQR
jgi:hypothetical protein